MTNLEWAMTAWLVYLMLYTMSLVGVVAFSSPGPVYCAECGAENPPGATYCVGCNKMLNP